MITLGSIFINQHSSLNEVRKKVLTIVKLLSEETIVATRVATATSEMCRTLYKLSIIFEIEFALNTTINHSALWLNFTANQSLPGINLLTPFFDQVQVLTLENNLYRVQAMLSLRDQQIFSNDAIAQIKSIIQQKSRNELMTELEDKNRELYQSLEDLKLTTLMKEKLQEQNLRMGAELNVSRMLQQMILPKPEELVIEKLDIAGFMEPADEVGGDYYDVLYTDGVVTLGIGDVTGHGLESGILMLMVQTAVRTLKEIREVDPVKFLDALNRTMYKNVQRMNSEKSLTLAIINYADGEISISGQHEEILIIRNNGKVERIDTMDLGFPIGLDSEIADFINHITLNLQPGDGVVLYTDGITEAKDINKVLYGIERLCEVISKNWYKSAQDVKDAVITDVRRHIGKQKVFDDFTLLVLKRESDIYQEMPQHSEPKLKA
ncbi:PP2C family protein-serine/threonine phosphatase [Nostoc sp. CENA67]|uniref:PP2C family protein-serine/threonine phosphatase n=1 Tax=Amazonocrinis nigriterrae CENA67 TaxID=2794033 RepID=A0A8J7HUE1_9NOST|nr:PP2C family protein-serine/threonine phosphatase [Amazonocrinis nigriterrae]MBH8563525.1 PP2C family protein-serine/threonine phosphatase [Amazonocrinis nigriterrae CENA67]